MDKLAALTPLGAAHAHEDSIGAMAISEVTDTALGSVAMRLRREADFATAATDLFGISMPGPGHWAPGTPYNLIWTGPDQWFVEAPLEGHEDIDIVLKDKLGDTASVTGQTDGWVRFDLTGATVVDLLERLCPAPARQMQTGDATRTLLEHMGCLLICRDAGQRFSVLGPRSFAASLHHTLCAAARSIA